MFFEDIYLKLVILEFRLTMDLVIHNIIQTLVDVVQVVFQATTLILYRDDVLDSFIMAYMDEDSIWDQIYEKQIFSTFYYKD